MCVGLSCLLFGGFRLRSLLGGFEVWSFWILDFGGSFEISSGLQLEQELEQVQVKALWPVLDLQCTAGLAYSYMSAQSAHALTAPAISSLLHPN